MQSLAEQVSLGVWEADMILGESDWQIRLCVGRYDTERQAERAANKAVATVAQVDGRVSMMVILSGERRVFSANELDIGVLTAAARQRLGRPLDVRDLRERAVAVQALVSRDPAYIVSDHDFESVPDGQAWLSQLFARYGEGYRPDHIGLGVRWVPLDIAADDELAIIVATGDELPASLREDLLLEEIAERAIEDGRLTLAEQKE